MELLVNDLSFHGQFEDVPSFRAALSTLMTLRRTARRFGREVHCNRCLLNATPLPNVSMQQALTRLNRDEQRAVRLWLLKAGPFWDDLRSHDRDDWFECQGSIVTDRALGEAAFRSLSGIDSALIGASPSDWDSTPLEVQWRREAENLNNLTTYIANWWEVDSLERHLQTASAPVRTWGELAMIAANRFEALQIASDGFVPLSGVPFNRSSSDRIIHLLHVLDSLAREVAPGDNFTPEGQSIYQQYFVGRNALFANSSNAEIRDFRGRLTFRDPDSPAVARFCPWHGKERHMTLRLHFSWPPRHGERVHVVYVGPKLTKR